MMRFLRKGPFGLIQSLFMCSSHQYGFEMSLNSDFPVGSGLGGSATLSAVVLGCFKVCERSSGISMSLQK